MGSTITCFDIRCFARTRRICSGKIMVWQQSSDRNSRPDCFFPGTHSIFCQRTRIHINGIFNNPAFDQCKLCQAAQKFRCLVPGWIIWCFRILYIAHHGLSFNDRIYLVRFILDFWRLCQGVFQNQFPFFDLLFGNSCSRIGFGIIYPHF